MARQNDLLDIAAHYELTSVKYSMLKHEIKNILIQFFVDKYFFLFFYFVYYSCHSDRFAMRELEIKRQIDIEKLRLEHKEKIRQEKHAEEYQY